jgi:hypothetical protein
VSVVAHVFVGVIVGLNDHGDGCTLSSDPTAFHRFEKFDPGLTPNIIVFQDMGYQFIGFASETEFVEAEFRAFHDSIVIGER